MGGVQDPRAGRTQEGRGVRVQAVRAVALLWVKRKGLIRNGGSLGTDAGIRLGQSLESRG